MPFWVRRLVTAHSSNRCGHYGADAPAALTGVINVTITVPRDRFPDIDIARFIAGAISLRIRVAQFRVIRRARNGLVAGAR